MSKVGEPQIPRFAQSGARKEQSQACKADGGLKVGEV